MTTLQVCSWYVDVMDPRTGDHLGNVRCIRLTETGSYLEHETFHGPMVADCEGLAKLRRDGR